MITNTHFTMGIRSKNYLLLLILLAVGMSANSQQLSQNDAAEIARGFWVRHSIEQRKVRKNVEPELSYTASKGDEILFYIFNSADGFVIVSGDSCTESILGYSESGTFDYDEAPEDFKWWLNQYSSQIHTAISTGSKAAKVYKLASKTDVVPLLATQWNQFSPYNGKLANSSYATGCVATAMAQVMKYYSYPATSTYNTYDWGNMLDTYTSGLYTQTQADAVATLMYDAGLSVNMDYGTTSSASVRSITSALVNTFSYDAAIQFADRDYYSDSEWEDLLYNEIVNGRPVIYGGTSGSSGHAFIVDGYQSSSDKFHINWGWGGYCDGYFLITGAGALTPGGSGAGGAGVDASYTSNQQIVIGMQPDCDNPATESAVASAFALLSSSLTNGETLSFSLTFYNVADNTTTFNVGLKLVNQSTNVVTYIPYASQSFTLALNQGVSDGGKGFRVSTIGLADGTYDVTPVFKNRYSVWTDIRLSQSVSQQTLTISPATSGLSVAYMPEFGKEGNNNYVTLADYSLHVGIKNNSNTDISTRLIAFLFPASGRTSIGYYDFGDKTYKAGETTEITISEIKNYTLVEGERYTIQLQDDNGSTTLLPAHTSYLTVVSETSYDFILPSSRWSTICLPFTADIPSGLTVYSATSYAGSKLNYEKATKIEMNTPYIVTGTPGTYTFSGPTTTEGTYQNGLLIGTTGNNTEAHAGSYILQNVPNKSMGFVKSDSRTTIGQYSAYLQIDDAGSAVYFVDPSYNPSIDMGDINEDFKVDVNDYTGMVSMILETDGGKFNLSYADFNANGFADVADLTSLVNVIMGITYTNVRKAQILTLPDTYGLSAKSTALPNGTQINLTFKYMSLSDKITNLQLEVHLPDGVVLEDIEGGPMISHHSLSIAHAEGTNTYRIMIHSAANRTIDADDGNALSLILNTEEVDANESNDIYINKVYASLPDATLIQFEDVTVSAIADEATAIDYVNGNNSIDKNTDIYDLTGKKVNKIGKGLYIVGGKKVYNK